MKNIKNKTQMLLNNIQIIFLFIVTLFFANLTFANTASSTNVGLKLGIFESILQASIIVQIVILILLSLSIVCWGIAWNKYQEFKSLKSANEAFQNIFWKSSSLDDLFLEVDKHKESSHARVYKAAYSEMKKMAESPMLNKTLNSQSEPLQLSGLDNLERSIRKATENELAYLETKLNILASTGSTGPFIGLFGTVWGIMNSFHQIGITGSASLAAVAPGISEALITTAIGLAAAIPAVILYNHFITEIKKEEIQLNNFAADFLNIVKRNFFKA